MGQCYEKLGTAQTQEAQKAYERMVRDFADQKEAVAAARAHLDSMGTPGTSPRGATHARLILVLARAAELYGSNVTTDGRYVSSGDSSTGTWAPAIRDLQTGQIRRVADKVGDAEVQGALVMTLISPNGKCAGLLRIQYHAQVWALENFLPSRPKR